LIGQTGDFGNIDCVEVLVQLERRLHFRKAGSQAGDFGLGLICLQPR
jgi:hypothetical protein